jgi:hypothetical protein
MAEKNIEKLPDDITTLDPVMIRDIENLLVRKQLVEAEGKLAEIAMQEVVRKRQACVTDEATIVAKLEKQVGKKLVGKIELLDREKGTCRIA